MGGWSCESQHPPPGGQDALGPDHPDVAEILDGMAYFAFRQGRQSDRQALLLLGRVDEARPAVTRLLAAGWDDPDFLELCRQHGLVDE